MEFQKLPTQGEIYIHYKHNSSFDEWNYYYEIIGIAKHSESDEILVVYKPLYQSLWMTQSQADFAVRPLNMFLEIVDKPEFDYSGPRFRLKK